MGSDGGKGEEGMLSFLLFSFFLFFFVSFFVSFQLVGLFCGQNGGSTGVQVPKLPLTNACLDDRKKKSQRGHDKKERKKETRKEMHADCLGNRNSGSTRQNVDFCAGSSTLRRQSISRPVPGSGIGRGGEAEAGVRVHVVWGRETTDKGGRISACAVGWACDSAKGWRGREGGMEVSTLPSLATEVMLGFEHEAERERRRKKGEREKRENSAGEDESADEVAGKGHVGSCGLQRLREVNLPVHVSEGQNY